MNNKTKLLNHFVAINAVPPGSGLGGAMRFFTDASYQKEAIKQAFIDLERAIELVKNAPDNPYGDDDNVIAGEILAQIERRKNSVRTRDEDN